MEYADKILISRTIFTATDKEPVSGSVIIKENKIVDVLDDSKDQSYEKYAGDNTEVHDFGDKLIMPGFIDAHIHYFVGAMSASDHVCTEIENSTSIENCVEIVKKFVEEHPGQKRIIGIGWYPVNWKEDILPDKRILDEAFPDTPVYLIAADIHTFWMNTAALVEAGITTDMNPPSGEIGKFENGELSGMLFEPEAFKPAMVKVYDADKETMRNVHKNFLSQIAQNGITSISDMSSDDYFNGNMDKYEVVKEMEDEGQLTARMHFYTRLEGFTDFSEALKYREKYSSEKLMLGGVKGFVDGVTTTYTGYMLEPYADKPETCGIGVPLTPKDEMTKSIVAANAAGLDVRLHCIGDAAVRMGLDMYEESNSQNDNSKIVNSIEHIESIDPKDIPRFGQLNAIPSLQPVHLVLDSFEKITRIGEERSKYEWPLKSFLETGGKLAFSTDYPVVNFNPFMNLYVAVYRKNPDGTEASVNPWEAISLSDALIAYTKGAATAYNRLDDLGTLEKGKLADIAVIDRNLFDSDEKGLMEASVEMTIMDGKIVYKA